MNKIKKGDTVQILLGKDHGKTGSVERVIVKEGKLMVAGVNMYKRHVKKHQGMEGGIVELSRPVNSSNVALICPSCKKMTRVGIKMEGTEKLRICRKCEKEIK